MNRLLGKRALVTAAGQGIGRASALAMAREGAEVWATDVDEAALPSLLAEWEAESGTARATGTDGSVTLALQPDKGRIVARRLDVLDPEAVRAAARELPAPQVLFNCAGHVHHGTILDCDEEAWDFSVRLNMTAMYRMYRAFLPGMIANGGGSIVNMASVASTVIAAPNRFVYGATKAGVIGLTKAVAADFVGQGIRCNAICPGTVESPSLEQRMRRGGDYDAARAAFIGRQPMNRLGRPEEIAALVLYLASDESSYTTGTEHVIDGGWSNL
ncbi:2-keto-3-deoxy-L-fuconate dehydrogenase [Rubellimicrobium mesophilum DSM 19309]|uniref:2-keto-3-deoxy-L-fuconate dehydrogenase n=1 Tax=Rubellimicrobium mesophilum DSM 19309 TaxID=442562 RepID=A0A017HPH7_9RHOB|nr:SDR family oxidoreductase [Rubellimicrobium mesophilum]EYD76407.1 2-keto-3-deoxy-L-fuconate dehydrogenase [Rubellimicrobium mesophilum DSM 19309]